MEKLNHYKNIAIFSFCSLNLLKSYNYIATKKNNNKK